jgi:hypothetical protein
MKPELQEETQAPFWMRSPVGHYEQLSAFKEHVMHWEEQTFKII